MEKVFLENNLDSKSNIGEVMYLLSFSKNSVRRYIDKLKETMAILSGKVYKTNVEYEGALRVLQEEVEREPRRWNI